MLKFRAFDTLINDYDLLRENTWGNEFDKALALFSVYCGFGIWTTRYWSNHKTLIAEVVALYHGEEGYLKEHKYTLACDIVFLLLQITLRIPQIDIDQQGGLAAIFQVIFNKTKINPYKFYNDMPLLQAFNAKNPDFVQTIVKYRSWAEFILHNACDFPPDLAIENSGYAHPINPESLKLFMNDPDFSSHSWISQGEQFSEYTMHSTFKNKGSLKQGEISFLLYCDLGSSYWIQSDTKLKDRFNKAVSSLSYVCLAALLDVALQKKHYAVVFYLFCHAYKLTMPDFLEIRGKINDQNTLMSKIFDTIETPIDSILLVKIINSGIKPRYLLERANNKPYLLLCSKHRLIENFEGIEEAYLNLYEPDINRVYFKALFSKKTMAIESLLKINRLNLIENDKLSYCFNMNQHHEIDCFLYNKNDGVTFTALQAVLVVALDANKDLLLFLLDTLKLFIKHRPDCLLQLDSMSNSVDYYIKKMQARNIYKENQEVVGQISGLIKSEHLIYKILPFIRYRHYGPEQIPGDIFSVIYAFTFELHTH